MEHNLEVILNKLIMYISSKNENRVDYPIAGHAKLRLNVYISNLYKEKHNNVKGGSERFFFP